MKRLIATTLVAIAFATNAVAEDTKWAPPNVVGMPGYHETTEKPAKTAEKPAPKSQVMTWDIVAGNWKQFSGKIKQKWGQLTDDELALQLRVCLISDSLGHHDSSWGSRDVGSIDRDDVGTVGVVAA